jgi:adenosylmethionine---8-amino-7-oxononanoate aminotransferase
MQSLTARDHACIWHPYTSLRSSAPVIPIVRGEGVYLIDEQQNHYIDAISSWWVTLHGHAHPYIASCIYKQALQLEQVIFAGFTHEPAVQLAEKLLQFLDGGFSKIFYSDNGSTAVEVAVKMALQYWWNQGHHKKRKLLAFTNAYHGDTFGAMSVSGRSIFTQAFNDKLFEVVFVETPTEENLPAIQSLIKSHKDDLAGFIYEPLVQGAGGMLMYEPQLLNEVLATCMDNDVLCIADEVMTGFGRTGKRFASHYLKQQPDIVCLSKGLTGGTMALGVTAASEKIASGFDTADKLKTFFHGHSFTANPLACSAALASLELLQKESCLVNIERIAAAHRNFIESLSQHQKITNARATGTILAFEANYGEKAYLNEVSSKITSFMLKRNVYLRPLGNTVYLMPPYCITMEELETVYSAVIECLDELR